MADITPIPQEIYELRVIFDALDRGFWIPPSAVVTPTIGQFPWAILVGMNCNTDAATASFREGWRH